MVALSPFRAVRPEPGQAAAVAAVPYDVVSTSEARALAAGNPLSFLHVSRAEIDLPDDIEPHADLVYERAAANFARLRAAAPLVEDEPSLYVYRLKMGNHVQTGIAGGFSVDEYERDVIRKHERTRKDKEDDRTRHIIELRAQTGPVFLVYDAAARIDRIVDASTGRPALLDLVADDRTRHTIWRLDDQARDALVAAFAGVPVMYIADGHHRAASAMRARNELRARPGGAAGSRPAAEADAFLAVAFPHDQTRILPYHRYVTDLAGHTPEEFLGALRQQAEVRTLDAAPPDDGPSEPGTIAMYLAGAWYEIRLAASADAPTRPARSEASASDRLDVARLQAQVLEPLLRIGDPRTDQRIGFVGGIRGSAALAALVDDGSAAVAFVLRPVEIRDLMRIADGGGIMPPKSTWFEPKLRDGLLSHLI
jgi:uncharacterized protein (DUF1015 family)